MNPQKRVDALMSNLPEPKPRGVIAKNEDLALAIKYTMEKIAAGALPMGFRRFYEHHLKKEFKGPCYETARTYCVDILRVDTQTGEAL